MKLNVLFPVETISRELDFRLFAAARCATPKNRIWVGQHDVVFRLSQQMRGGIYLGKHIFLADFPWETMERYRAVKARGTKVVFLDEEGGIYQGGPDHWRWVLDQRIDVGRLGPEDWVMTWGDFQTEHYTSQAPACVERVRTTGHPRFDLCKPAYRAYFQPQIDAIRARFGRFVLVNTNLTLANPALGVGYAFWENNGWDVKDPAKRRHHISHWAHITRNLVEFVALVNELSIDFPDTNFVIRPHPSEGLAFYETVFGKVPNVRVVREGNVAAWLMSCEMLLQDGCTTGVEGYLAGANVVNYKAVEDAAIDLIVPNAVGRRCTNAAEVTEALRAVRGGAKISRESRLPADARSVFCNFEEDSFARFLDVYRESEGEAEPGAFDRRGWRANDAAHRAIGMAKSAIRPLFPERMHRARTFASMFPGFDRADIRSRLDRVEAIVGRKLELEFHGPELFSLELAT